MGVTKWLTQACTIPPTMSNHTASVSNMTINRNNAATTNALTMPSGMVFDSNDVDECATVTAMDGTMAPAMGGAMARWWK